MNKFLALLFAIFAAGFVGMPSHAQIYLASQASSASPDAATSSGAISLSNGTTKSTLEDSLAPRLTVYDIGLAPNDPAKDGQNSSRLNAVRGQKVYTPQTWYLSATKLSSSAFDLKGSGPFLTTFKRDGAGNLFSASSSNGLILSNFALDNGYSTNGNSGHGIALTDPVNVRLSHLRVFDFGNNGGSAGSGIVAFKSLLPQTRNVALDDIWLTGDTTTSTRTEGTVLSDCLYCNQGNILSEDILQYAIEYKNNSQYSVLHDSIAHDSASCFGYGQQSGIGPNFIAAGNLVSSACDAGFDVGGKYDTLSSMVIDSTGRHNYVANGGVGIDFDKTGGNSYFTDVLTFGVMRYPVRFESSHNAIDLSSQDSASKIVTFFSGVANDYVHIVNPGTRTTIANAVNDISGSSGSSSNVVDSPMTREYFGSISGYLGWWRNSAFGGSFPSTHNLRYENNGTIAQAFGIPDGSGNSAGIFVDTSVTNNLGSFFYSQGSTHANDYWDLTVNSTDLLRFFRTVIRPVKDNAADLGAPSFRFANGNFVNAIITGTLSLSGKVGSPNQVVCSGGSSPASWCERQQFFSGCSNGALTSGTTLFFAPNGGTGQTTGSKAAIPLPYAGTVKNLHVTANTAPTAGQTFVYTIETGGADSSVVATISNRNINASDTTHAVAASIAQMLGLKIVSSAGAASALICWSFEYDYN